MTQARGGGLAGVGRKRGGDGDRQGTDGYCVRPIKRFVEFLRRNSHVDSPDCYICLKKTCKCIERMVETTHQIRHSTCKVKFFRPL